MIDFRLIMDLIRESVLFFLGICALITVIFVPGYWAAEELYYVICAIFDAVTAA